MTDSFQVAGFQVVPARNEVIPAGAPPVKLPPLAMNVLVFLAQHAGEVVTTEALMSEVWAGRVVGDNTLYNTIAQLRRAFGDQRKPHQLIVTVPKRGYRLATPVSWSAAGTTTRRNRLPWLVATTGVALVLVMAWWGLMRTGEDVQRIAMLPFEVHTDEDEDERLSGLAVSLASRLARVPGLAVVSGENVRRAMKDNGTRFGADPKLDVDALLTGEIHRQGEEFRLRLTLIAARDMELLWSQDFHDQPERLLALTDMATAAIVRHLGRELPSTKPVTESNVALEQYSIARYFREQQAPQSIVRASWHYQKALEADPDFIDALVELCDAYLLQADHGDISPGEAHEECKPLLERVMRVHPASADAFASRGLLKHGSGHWNEALSSYDMALDLDPKHVNALQWSGVLLRERGEHDRALARHAQAATIHPSSLSIQRELALSLLAKGDIRAAQVHFMRADGISPEDGSSVFEQLNYGPLSREHAEATIRWAQAHRSELAQYPNALIAVALVRLSLGDADGARDDLQAAQDLAPELPALHYGWAVLHFNGGRYDEALQSLQRRKDAASGREGFNIHLIIFRGLAGQASDELLKLENEYAPLRNPEHIPADHFFMLHVYALLQRLGGDQRAGASLARLRELLPDCTTCDAMTRAELLALDGEHARARELAAQLVADGWLPNHHLIPWNHECNPFFNMLPLDERQRSADSLCRSKE